MGPDSDKWKSSLLERKLWLQPLFQNVRPGKIVEFGCGNGFVLEDLSKEFQGSSIIGIDLNDNRLDAVIDKNLSNVITMNADITSKLWPDRSIDTALFVGVLHEIYSYYGKKKVLETLKITRETLKDDGVLIIQDFLRPEPEQVMVKFKTEEITKRFQRFTNEFVPREIKFEKTEQGIILDIGDLVEFMSKINSLAGDGWEEEKDEAHFYFTENEFITVVEGAGFTIKSCTKLTKTEEWWADTREKYDFQAEPEYGWIQLVLIKTKPL